MFKYEITFIVGEAEANEPVSKIVEAVGGKITGTKDLGIKSFTYPIAKQKAGRYFCLYFEIEPADLIKLEKPLRLNKSVLRYVVVKALRARPPRPPKQAEGSKQQAVGEQTKIQSRINKEESDEKAIAETDPKLTEAPTEETPIEVPVVQPKPVVAKPVEIKVEGTEEKKIESETPREPIKPRVKKVEKKPKPEPKIEVDKLDEKLKDLISE